MTTQKISIEHTEHDEDDPSLWHLNFWNDEKDKDGFFRATFIGGAYKGTVDEPNLMILISVDEDPETRLEINFGDSTVLYYNYTLDYVYFKFTLPKKFMDALDSYLGVLPDDQYENVLREKVINLNKTTATDPTPLVGGKRKKSRRQTRKRR